MNKAINDVIVERQRQIDVEGYDEGHDSGEHQRGELAYAASCYAFNAATNTDSSVDGDNNEAKRLAYDEILNLDLLNKP